MNNLNSIGITINQNKQVKRSLKSEFFEDFFLIFTGADDLVGIFFSLIYAVFFVIRWGLFLVGKFILRLNVNKPKIKYNQKNY